MKSLERYIISYAHAGQIGVLVEFAIATDFTSRTEVFQKFAKDVALQIAASNPSDVEELLTQPSVKDETRTVGELLNQLSELCQEEISVTRFIRWDATTRPSVDGPDDRPPVIAALRIAK